jgi:hypothetical protein
MAIIVMMKRRNRNATALFIETSHLSSKQFPPCNSKTIWLQENDHRDKEQSVFCKEFKGTAQKVDG